MALKLQNNTYVKLDTLGNFTIYRTKTERLKELKSINSQTVLDKYQEIISKMLQDPEWRYYTPDAYDIIEAWETEYTKYINNLHTYNASETYPLMKSYIKMVDKTIPEILWQGNIGQQADTLAELYEIVKNLKIFGETEDI